VIVEFKNIVSGSKIIPNLGAKIAAEEMPQVLFWALQGATRLAENNFILSLTDSHEVALEKWKNTRDSVFCFLGDGEIVARVPGSRTPKKEAYSVYRNWCLDMGVKAVGYHEFLERCGLKHKEVKQSGQRRCFGDMQLMGGVCL